MDRVAPHAARNRAPPRDHRRPAGARPPSARAALHHRSRDPGAWARVPWSGSTSNYVRGLVPADLDGDGVLDMAVAKMSSNRLVILKQGN